jgi:hypothetical protein
MVTPSIFQDVWGVLLNIQEYQFSLLTSYAFRLKCPENAKLKVGIVCTA